MTLMVLKEHQIVTNYTVTAFLLCADKNWDVLTEYFWTVKKIWGRQNLFMLALEFIML